MRLELTTPRPRVTCSTSWANQAHLNGNTVKWFIKSQAIAMQTEKKAVKSTASNVSAQMKHHQVSPLVQTKRSPECFFYLTPHAGQQDSLPLHCLEHKGTGNRPDWLLCSIPALAERRLIHRNWPTSLAHWAGKDTVTEAEPQSALYLVAS